jgi:hypothetical protein
MRRYRPVGVLVMTIEMIEAAWTDPMLRRELTEKGDCDIPDHPVGILKGFPDEFAGAETPEDDANLHIAAYSGINCGYYWNSYFNCNATYAVSGVHCCQ